MNAKIYLINPANFREIKRSRIACAHSNYCHEYSDYPERLPPPPAIFPVRCHQIVRCGVSDNVIAKAGRINKRNENLRHLYRSEKEPEEGAHTVKEKA